MWREQVFFGMCMSFTQYAVYMSAYSVIKHVIQQHQLTMKCNDYEEVQWINI